MRYLIVKKLNKKIRPVSKFCYFNKRLNYLAFAATCVDRIRTFKNKESAMDFIDKKWMKYPDFVKHWKIKTTADFPEWFA